MTVLPAKSTATGPVPVRACGVELLGELSGSGYRRPPALARRADGQTVQLTPLLYLVLGATDGQRSYVDIAERVSAAAGRSVTPDNVRLLVEDRLAPLGLVRTADGAEPVVAKANPLLALRFRFVVADPERTRGLTAPFARLFQPAIVVAVVLAFAAVTWSVLFREGLAAATHQAFERPALLLTVFAITVLSAGFHEFGHAAAARRGGATPGAMGAGLYLVWPAFYTDVTDSYRLDRAGRLRTDLGGLYFNATLAVAVYGGWLVTGWHALLLVVATQILQMVRQLAPMVRFDGYHLLADLTGVPDLYHRIRPTLLGLVPGRRDPGADVLKPWARAVVTTWVVLVVPLLLTAAVLMVVALPRVLATGFAGMDRQWTALGARAGAGDVAAATAAGLAIVAIAVPLLGMLLILAGFARRVVRGTWRATSGHPVRRATAGVALLGVLAWLAWMWWPSPDTYRPVRPDEGGTVQDVVSSAEHRPRPTPVASPREGEGPREGVGPREGERGRRVVSWPANAPAPTAAEPRLALLLTPAEGNAPGEPTQTWVFPFDPPAAPGPGDNQALAVNTTDGSTRYDVSFALVWATGDRVANTNEAYALADCADCATVAIAFQVVLVVGQADVVVPENVAVAVNYGCRDCVTVAVARQLVLTLPGELSAAGQRALAALWEQVTDLAAHASRLPPADLVERLRQVEAAIADIVRRESTGAGTTTGEPPPGTSGPVPSTGAPASPPESTGSSEPEESGEPSEPGESTTEPPSGTEPPTTTTEPPTTQPAPSS